MRIGVGELLVLVVLLGALSLVVVLVRGGRLKTALMRLSEGRVYQKDLAVIATSRPMSADRLTFLGAVGILLLTSAPTIGAYAWMIVSNEPLIAGDAKWTQVALGAATPAVTLLTLLRVVPWLGIFIALYFQFRPGRGRRAKYVCILCFVSTGAWSWIDVYLNLMASSEPLSPAWYSWRQYRHSIPISALVVLALLNPPVALAIADLAINSWRRKIDDRGALGWHRLLRIVALPVLLLFSPHPILMIYLLMRYHVNEFMAEKPIVYLRSFRHTQGANAFGRIVVKVASRHGVLTAIVHRAQRGSALLSLANALDHVRVEQVPDAQWQEWVIRRLKSATAVVIDVTITSPAVAWELSTALSHVRPERIVLLAEKGAAFPMAEGVARIEYGLDSSSIKTARQSLAAWFKALARASSAAAGPNSIDSDEATAAAG